MRASTLLVDDDESIRHSLTRVFEQQRILLATAATWEDGLAQFRVGLHSLVIADYNLPGSDHGLKLLLHMKRFLPNSRLILISGALPSKAQELVKTTLVDKFLEKRLGYDDELVEEAKMAAGRAAATTNWATAASAYLGALSLKDDDIAAIDAALLKLLP